MRFMTNSLRLFGSVSREPTLGDHLDAAMPGVGWIDNLFPPLFSPLLLTASFDNTTLTEN
jgi:hypothetical protein